MSPRNFLKGNYFFKGMAIDDACRQAGLGQEAGVCGDKFTYDTRVMDTQYFAFVKTHRTFYSTRMNFSVCK